MKIDVDGSGPLRPFPVTCEFYGRRSTLYIVQHCTIIRTFATLLGTGWGGVGVFFLYLMKLHAFVIVYVSIRC